MLPLSETVRPASNANFVAGTVKCDKPQFKQTDTFGNAGRPG